jgi:4-amino-4-deoxy-L-arabinose transferase-like glycosyltransferase
MSQTIHDPVEDDTRDRAGRSSVRIPIRVVLAAIFVCALAIRLGITFAADPRGWLYSDMAVYDRVAQHWLHLALTADDTFTPAGYPLFLAGIYAVFGPSLVIVSVIQALLGALTCVFAALIARQLSGNVVAAATAGLVVAVYPPLVYYGALVLTEAVAPFWWAVSVWLLLRSVSRGTTSSAALAGFSLSMATLIRPNLLLLFPWVLLFAWVAHRGERWKATRTCLAIGAAAAPLLAGAVAVNSYLLDRPAGLSTNGGMNFFLMQADVQTVTAQNAGWTPVRNLLFYSEIFVAPVPTYDEAFFYREGVERLRARPDPIRHALRNLSEGLGLGQQGYFPANGHLPDELQPQAFLRQVLRVCSKGFFWFLLVPVLAGIAVAVARGRLFQPAGAPVLLAAGMVFAMVVTAVTFLAEPRMHVPFDAVMIAYVAAFVVRTLEWAGRPRAA